MLAEAMRRAIDVAAIEREVDAELEAMKLFADPPKEAEVPTFSSDRNGISDVEMGAFLSHQPQYRHMIVAKKLLLYEKKLEVREKQLVAAHVRYEQAAEAIRKLKETVKAQQKAFDAAQDEWEEEKANLLRFRGAGAAASASNTLMLRMKMGMSAVAMAARSRNQNDIESQEQYERRMQLLRGAVEVQDEWDGDVLDSFRSAKSRSKVWWLWKRMMTFCTRRMYPFASDVRQIEARFGYSVASYFRFFRWIIMSFVAISIPALVSLVLHVLALKAMGHYTSVDWTSFVGVAPGFLLFSRYHPFEGFVYSLVLGVMQVLLLVLTIRKWITEDRHSKTLEALDGGSQKPKFAKIVLNAWDFSISSHEQASDMRKSIAEQIKVTQQEDRLTETLRRRSRRDRYKLYARRVVTFVIYMVIQIAGWYVIILVTTQSSEIQFFIAANASLLAPYVTSIVPAIVSIINGILPAVISFLTAMEKWDDVGFAIKAMVTRLYLAKVLNVLIQLASYALLLDPYLLTGRENFMDIGMFDGPSVRRNVMLAFKPSAYTCRAEQVAAGLLNLVVTDFAIGKVAAVVMPLAMVLSNHLRRLWSRWREKRQLQTKIVPMYDNQDVQENSSEKDDCTRPASDLAMNHTSLTSAVSLIKKSEFHVPQKMVALLYSCTIALVAIPLAPTAALLALVLHIINFKFDKLVLMHFQKKPTHPWSAKDAGSFFIKFYFCTVIIFVIFSHFFLSSPRLPKQCAIQDAYINVTGDGSASESLCLESTYDSTTELCTLNANNSRSAYFVPTHLVKDECAQGYPKCVCSAALACGPFVNVRDGYTPLVGTTLSVRVISGVYKLVVSNTFVAWSAVIITAMGIFFAGNSLQVMLALANAREHEVSVTFASLQRKIKQLENRLRVHGMGSNVTGRSG